MALQWYRYTAVTGSFTDITSSNAEYLVLLIPFSKRKANSSLGTACPCWCQALPLAHCSYNIPCGTCLHFHPGAMASRQSSLRFARPRLGQVPHCYALITPHAKLSYRSHAMTVKYFVSHLPFPSWALNSSPPDTSLHRILFPMRAGMLPVLFPVIFLEPWHIIAPKEIFSEQKNE